ncbi:hypothetical protein BDR26DRAFT_925018 [Obelidium mucronatum]|nr:hypothetical protein BDR26DRAFT_925018 [Obelidium mucronatum]
MPLTKQADQPTPSSSPASASPQEPPPLHSQPNNGRGLGPRKNSASSPSLNKSDAAAAPALPSSPASPAPPPPRNSQIARLSSSGSTSRRGKHVPLAKPPPPPAAASFYAGIYTGPPDDASKSLGSLAQAHAQAAQAHQAHRSHPHTPHAHSPALSRASSHTNTVGSGGSSTRTVDIDDSAGSVNAVDPSINIARADCFSASAGALPTAVSTAYSQSTMPTASSSSRASKHRSFPIKSSPSAGNISTTVSAVLFGTNKPFAKFSSRKKSLGVCTVSSSMSSSAGGTSQVNLLSSTSAAPQDDQQIQQQQQQQQLHHEIHQLRDLVGKLRTEQYELTRQIQDDRNARIKLERDFAALQERVFILDGHTGSGGGGQTDSGGTAHLLDDKRNKINSIINEGGITVTVQSPSAESTVNGIEPPAPVSNERINQINPEI